jgi:exosortase A-associated hydrolase 2
VIAAAGTNLVPFFAATPRGRRFAIESRDRDEPRGGVLFVHPFAEENNKSRRMAALTAGALSDDGWTVLRCDLHGCGDSEGDFSDATWNSWCEDLSFWTDWLRARTDGPLLVWALRAGALLAVDWIKEAGGSLPLLLWQPVTNGQRHLTQLLRLRAAASMLDAREARGVVSNLRETLAAGSPVTVAGYTLNPELANPLEQAVLQLPKDYGCPVSVLEITARPDDAPTTGLKRLVEAWQDSGINVRVSAVTGPPFWQTVEVETAPQLIEATVKEARELVA